MSMLRRLIWKVVPPFEVEVTRGAVRRFFEGDALSRELVEQAVLAKMANTERLVNTIRFQNCKPDQLALGFIHDALFDAVTSGRYHAYRGVLSIEGEALLTTFVRCLKEMQRRGYQTVEQNFEAIKIIQAQIKEWG